MSTMWRFSSRRGWASALFGAASLAVGVMVGSLPAAPPPVVDAHGTCQAANAGCGGDPTKTGVLDVLHFKNGSTAVEPNTGESWNITAHWNPAAPGSCTGTHETASVDVDWNGAGWTLSNTSLTTNIVGISVCDIGGSCFSTTGARAYRLLVDVNDPIPGGIAMHLQEVSFSTTSVDNGLEFDMLNPCTITANVATPTSQNFNASDVGPFECGLNCSVTGATVTITY